MGSWSVYRCFVKSSFKTEKRQCFAPFQFVVSIIDLLPFFKGGEKKIDTQSSSYGECVWTIEANQRKFAAAFIQSAHGLFDPSSVSYWTKNALDWIIALQMNFLFLSWLIIILSKDCTLYRAKVRKWGTYLFCFSWIKRSFYRYRYKSWQLSRNMEHISLCTLWSFSWSFCKKENSFWKYEFASCTEKIFKQSFFIKFFKKFRHSCQINYSKWCKLNFHLSPVTFKSSFE